MNPRQVRIDMLYEGKNISEKVGKYKEIINYTDSENQSDSASIVFSNIDMKWLNEWIPQKEDRFTLKIEYEGETFDCGDFILDDLSYSGRPLVCNIKGVSAPIDEDFKSTDINKNWEGVSLKQISQEIANKANLILYFDVDDVQINSIEQQGKTNASFLKELCETYNYSLKIYSNKLLIFDPEKLSRVKPIKKFYESDFISWSYNTTLGGSYTGVELSYIDPKTKKTFGAKLGTNKRVLKINEKCENNIDAERIAKARFYKANQKISSLTVTLAYPVFLSSTQTVEVKGLGAVDGIYYIEQVKHSISAGYRMILEMRKVEKGLNNASD